MITDTAVEERLTQSQISNLIAPYMLEEMGFDLGSQSALPQIFRKISPKGVQSCYRDALIQGTAILVRLSQMLETHTVGQQWHLLHVIVIDHQDTTSSTELSHLIKTMRNLGQVIKVKMFKMIIIGLDLQPEVDQELQNITKAAGKEMAQYLSISDWQVDSILQRVAVMGGLETRKQVKTAYQSKNNFNSLTSSPEPELPNYAVLLSISGRQSMLGSKWNKLCGSLDKFLAYFTQNDLISGMIFSRQPKVVTKLSIKDSFFGDDYDDSISQTSQIQSQKTPSVLKKTKSVQSIKIIQKRSGKQGGGCGCLLM